MGGIKCNVGVEIVVVQKYQVNYTGGWRINNLQKVEETG